MPTKRRQATIVGEVVSDRMNKTIVVQVERMFRHAQFGKYIRRRKKFKAHDEKNECKTGDHVLLVHTRPLSKQKCWKVKSVLRKAV